MKAKTNAPAPSSKAAPPSEPLLYTQQQLDAAIADSKILDLREQAYQQRLAREAFFMGHFYSQLWEAYLPANVIFNQDDHAEGIRQLTAICNSQKKADKEKAPRAQIVLDMLRFFDEAQKQIARNEWAKVVDQALLFGGWLERLTKRNGTAGARARRGLPVHFQLFDRAERHRAADEDPRKPASLDCEAVVRYCPELGRRNTRTLQNQLSHWKKWRRENEAAEIVWQRKAEAQRMAWEKAARDPTPTQQNQLVLVSKQRREIEAAKIVWQRHAKAQRIARDKAARATAPQMPPAK